MSPIFSYTQHTETCLKQCQNLMFDELLPLGIISPVRKKKITIAKQKGCSRDKVWIALSGTETSHSVN